MEINSFLKARTMMTGILEATYGNPQASYKEANEEQIKNFMRIEDAEIIKRVAKSTYNIIFRAAGAATIKRIEDGHPCKGHNILDKSVKKINSTEWSYTGSEDLMINYQGLVGCSAGNLTNVWRVSDSGQDEKADIPVASDHMKKCYTGDYDMHDLIKINAGRVMAGTIDERAAINKMNAYLLHADPVRMGKVIENLRLKFGIDPFYRNTKIFTEDAMAKIHESSYALIRHGSQTNYVDYLMGETSELRSTLAKVPSGLMSSPIIKIDTPLLAFDEGEKIYYLATINEVYSYYSTKNFIGNIPFYYFFNDLLVKNKTTKIKGLIECCNFIEQCINHITNNKSYNPRNSIRINI